MANDKILFVSCLLASHEFANPKNKTFIKGDGICVFVRYSHEIRFHSKANGKAIQTHKMIRHRALACELNLHFASAVVFCSQTQFTNGNIFFFSSHFMRCLANSQGWNVVAMTSVLSVSPPSPASPFI